MCNIKVVEKPFHMKCYEHFYTAVQEILDSFTGYLINYPESFSMQIQNFENLDIQ